MYAGKRTSPLSFILHLYNIVKVNIYVKLFRPQGTAYRISSPFPWRTISISSVQSTTVEASIPP